MNNIYPTHANWHAHGDLGSQFHPHNSTPTIEALCKELSICSNPSEQKAKLDSLYSYTVFFLNIKLIMNATTTPFPEHERLKNVAEHCAALQYEYVDDEDYTAPYPIEGIPILLFPVDEDGVLLLEMLDIHKEILEDAREGDSLALLENRELSRCEGIAERGACLLGGIHLTLVYQSIHFQIQLNVFQSNNAQQIYFPGISIHDIPPVNIRFWVDPNWSTLEFLQNSVDFHRGYRKYSLLIDAYKFTHDASRIANAIQLSSREDHPFHEFFLAPRYIQIYRALLREEIAMWLDYNHKYWSVISP